MSTDRQEISSTTLFSTSRISLRREFVDKEDRVRSETNRELYSTIVEMNEELQSLREGGKTALAELFLQHHDRLERLIDFRLDQRLQSRVDSDDVLQEAYIEIARRLDDYLLEPEVSFYVWTRQLTLQTGRILKLSVF